MNATTAPRQSVSPKTNWTASQQANLLADEGARFAQALRSGHAQARETFVRRHAAEMLATATRIAGAQSAPEILRNAFGDLFENLDAQDDTEALARTLHLLVVRAALARRPRRELDGSVDRWLPEFSDDGHRVEATPQQQSRPPSSCPASPATIRAKIEMLPETHRVVLILRDVENLSVDETATALAMDPNAVRTRLHHARMALREMLDRDRVAI